MICKNCVYEKYENIEAAIDEGCTHCSLFDEEGNLIPEKVAMVENYMLDENCPLKARKNSTR